MCCQVVLQSDPWGQEGAEEEGCTALECTLLKDHVMGLCQNVGPGFVGFVTWGGYSFLILNICLSSFVGSFKHRYPS